MVTPYLLCNNSLSAFSKARSAFAVCLIEKTITADALNVLEQLQTWLLAVQRTVHFEAETPHCYSQETLLHHLILLFTLLQWVDPPKSFDSRWKVRVFLNVCDHLMSSRCLKGQTQVSCHTCKRHCVFCSISCQIFLR